MSDWDVNDPGVAARAAIADEMNACMHRSECRRLAGENKSLRQQLASAESDCRQRIRRDRMYCMSHGNEAVQQLVAENAELRQRVQDCESAILRRELMISQVEAELEQTKDRVTELENETFAACAEIIAREAEKLGRTQGLGKRMARLRLLAAASKLRQAPQEREGVQ
ncbi:hypothetical protein [Marinobacter sp. CA1]|uniref:hypothetical protein n=1 Tax=Marinobacter sp. CA1 TaxID=2817656 RepID=UPI001D066547|nr:hypothetical protein [Marinobacter sp. CA1]UDL04022.1 hypothetical protein J2887_15040 [Marinobacter sp. CA1]